MKELRGITMGNLLDIIKRYDPDYKIATHKDSTLMIFSPDGRHQGSIYLKSYQVEEVIYAQG